MSFRIVVANKVHGPVLEQLRAFGDVVINENVEPWSQDELQAHCRDADALMAFMTETIDASFIASCPNLKIIAGALKGYNNINVKACSERGIAVTIVPDLLTEPTAELTIGLMIALARNFVPGDQLIREGDFQGWRPQFYGGSIQGATVAVLGAGAVGQAILRMLGGFDCQKLYVDKTPLSPQTAERLKAQRVSLEEAQRTADFLVLALHLMPETLHLIDEEFLEKMKPGSYLINPARGSLVDEAAVVKALTREHLAGYAADTFEMEDWALPDRPRAIHEALLKSNKTILTPHLGSAVQKVREEIERSAAASIIAVSKGKIPDTAVNKPVPIDA